PHGVPEHTMSWKLISLILVALVLAAVSASGIYRLVTPESTTDFDGFYRFGRAALDGTDIYADKAGQRYLPAFALFMALFAWMPYKAAGIVFIGLNNIALIVVAWASARLAFAGRAATDPPATDRPEKVRRTAWNIDLVAPSLLAAIFIAGNIFLCQVNLPVLALGLLGVLWIAEERPLRGAVSLALAVALKVTPAIFLPYLLFRGKVRAFGLTVCCLLTLVFVPSFLVFGVDRTGNYCSRWIDANLAGTDTTGPDLQRSTRYNNQSLLATATRLLTATNAASSKSPRFVNIVSLSPSEFRLTFIALSILIALVTLGVWWRARLRPRDMIGPEAAFTWTVALLFSPISWTHHFIAVLPAMYVLWGEIRGGGADTRMKRIALWIVILAELCFLTVFFSEPRMYGSLTLGAVIMAVGMALVLSRSQTPPPGPGRTTPCVPLC
ncbi:MAG: glycosyltransferase family 87 protein, partial [Planctomycetota bacterium]|nr:glycosyltransferase family 87 protein [Planctomycetota bacterium]